MRIFLTVILALIAFAANSILVRIALANGQIGPGAFSAIRLGAGAIILLALARLRGEALFFEGFIGSGMALLIYAVGFSFAHMSLDTGTGALILFGGVQVTMFAGALVMGERPGKARWLGAVLALGGLVLLFGPKAGRPDIWGASMMAGAGLFAARSRGGLAGCGHGQHIFAGNAFCCSALAGFSLPDRGFSSGGLSGDCFGGTCLGGGICDLVFGFADD